MTHCIIVGAGPGLGLAIARRFGQAGDIVGLIARREDMLIEQVSELAQEGFEGNFQVADAGDEMALRGAIEKLVAIAGPCTTLVYNASVMKPERPLDLAPSVFQAEMMVNAVGGLVATQAVAPQMIERGRGAILFTGGGLSLNPYPEWASLGAGKAAQRSLAISLHKELGPSGIKVGLITICGIVAPGGPFDPDVLADAFFELATKKQDSENCELVFQPFGTDKSYNDPVASD